MAEELWPRAADNGGRVLEVVSANDMASGIAE